tara:strand:+ start:132 stop:377 length:246 start_codon:yes stop_codon:yes gene_type:complete
MVKKKYDYDVNPSPEMKRTLNEEIRKISPNGKKLSNYNVNKLREHQKHHTTKHLRFMINQIVNNKKTFTESHKLAMEKVGK